MPIHFDYETDTLYLRGTEKGMEKKSYLFVRNLLLMTDTSDETIARLVDVPLEFVKIAEIIGQDTIGNIQ